LREEHGKKRWVILDAGKSFRTGFTEEEIVSAEERLAQYVQGSYTPPRRSQQALVYYVTAAASDDYPIKIGFTALSMSRRLAQFQAGNPNILTCLATEVGSQAVELERHARFRHLHVRGEWFRREPALMAFISTLQPERVYT
jgi:hypothetical protein